MSLSGSLLVLLLLFMKPIIRHRLPKSAQYFFWLVVLMTFLIPVSRIVAFPGGGVNIAPIYNVVERNIISTTEARDRHPTIEGSAASSLPSSTDLPNESIPTTITGGAQSIEAPGLLSRAVTVFMVIYPVIFALVLLFNITGYVRFIKKLRRDYFRPHAHELVMLKELTGGKPMPKIIVSDHATTPMLVGIFKPMIVLPNREYTDQQMESILLHELTHMRRLDIVVKWLSLLACAMHWFNPLVWVATREIDRVCELSCDEIVISSMDVYGKRHYGETLISVASTKKIPMPVLSTTMCEEKRALKERLTAIMKSKKHTKLAVLVSIIILLTVILAACAAGAGGGSQSTVDNNINSESNGHEDQQVIDDSTTGPPIEDEDIDEPEITEPYNDTENNEQESNTETAENPIGEPAALDRPAYITILGEQFSTDLTMLSLDGPLTNEDILPLKYMTEMTALWFGVQDPFNQITDLSPLAGLTNLSDLYFTGGYLADLTPLAGLTNLSWIHIFNTQIADITPLAGLTNLTTLQLGASQVTDITPLAGLTNLTSLDLSWNQISDISPLAGLTNLHSLNLRDNQITYVTPLANLVTSEDRSNLAQLFLSNNQISDVTPLAHLNSLESLWLDGNPITDLSPVAHMPSIVFEMMDPNP